MISETHMRNENPLLLEEVVLKNIFNTPKQGTSIITEAFVFIYNTCIFGSK